jgi:RNA polymerase sigma factor
MQTKTSEKLAPEPEELIARLRNGETELREHLIKTYWDYISAVVARMTGKYAKSTDEFSIALEAFNEAIDKFDSSRHQRFISFAGMVINRRIIDYFRKNRKFESEYPFSALGSEPGPDLEERLEKLRAAPVCTAEHYEIQEEILAFQESLKSFGITFEGLLNSAPKHSDTKALCAIIAKKVAEDDSLSVKLLKETSDHGDLKGIQSQQKNHREAQEVYHRTVSNFTERHGYCEGLHSFAD